jgi:hypothetical protein
VGSRSLFTETVKSYKWNNKYINIVLIVVERIKRKIEIVFVRI